MKAAMLGVFFFVFFPVMGQSRGHSFEIDENTLAFDVTQTTFTGSPTAPSALNKLMVAQLFDEATGALIATGNSRLFSTIDIVFDFMIDYPAGSVLSGQTVVVSVSDVPGLIGGNEGDAVVSVFDAGVPTLSEFALIAMIGLFMLLGLRAIYNRKAAARP